MMDDKRNAYEEYESARLNHSARSALGTKTLTKVAELTDEVDSTRQKLGALNALYSGKGNIYAGTVPVDVVRARRAKNKRARKARKANR